MSRRRTNLAVIVVIVVLASWYLTRPSAEERHLQGLFEEAFSVLEIDPSEIKTTGSFVDSYEDLCPEISIRSDRWIRRNSLKRIDGRDHRPSAVEVAAYYEADGWMVERSVQASQGSQTYLVLASRATDRILLFLGDGSLDISASSGPCTPYSQWPEAPFFDQVAEFPPVTP